MGLKLSISVQGNIFDADGEFDFNPELTSLFRVWVAAIGGADGVTLEELTEHLEGNTQRLEDAVTANTPDVVPALVTAPSGTAQKDDAHGSLATDGSGGT